MPDATIIAPVTTVPIDRLTLGATDAREIAAGSAQVSPSAVLLGVALCTGATCMAEE